MTANIYATEALIKSNTFQLQYDFSKRLTFRIGYEYTNRTIADFSATFYTAETYFPGGAAPGAGPLNYDPVGHQALNFRKKDQCQQRPVDAS